MQRQGCWPVCRVNPVCAHRQPPCSLARRVALALEHLLGARCHRAYMWPRCQLAKATLSACGGAGGRAVELHASLVALVPGQLACALATGPDAWRISRSEMTKGVAGRLATAAHTSPAIAARLQGAAHETAMLHLGAHEGGKVEGLDTIKVRKAAARLSEGRKGRRGEGRRGRRGRGRGRGR